MIRPQVPVTLSPVGGSDHCGTWMGGGASSRPPRGRLGGEVAVDVEVGDVDADSVKPADCLVADGAGVADDDESSDPVPDFGNALFSTASAGAIVDDQLPRSIAMRMPSPSQGEPAVVRDRLSDRPPRVPPFFGRWHRVASPPVPCVRTAFGSPNPDSSESGRSRTAAELPLKTETTNDLDVSRAAVDGSGRLLVRDAVFEQLGHLERCEPEAPPLPRGELADAHPVESSQICLLHSRCARHLSFGPNRGTGR